MRRKAVFRLCILFQKSLCQITGHENKPGHMEKVDKGSDTDGEGGIHILQIAEEMPADHQNDQNTFDIIDMIVSCFYGCCLLTHVIFPYSA